jgi:hypothetical protein
VAKDVQTVRNLLAARSTDRHADQRDERSAIYNYLCRPLCGAQPTRRLRRRGDRSRPPECGGDPTSGFQAGEGVTICSGGYAAARASPTNPKFRFPAGPIIHQHDHEGLLWVDRSRLFPELANGGETAHLRRCWTRRRRSPHPRTAVAQPWHRAVASAPLRTSSKTPGSILAASRSTSECVCFVGGKVMRWPGRLLSANPLHRPCLFIRY